MLKRIWHLFNQLRLYFVWFIFGGVAYARKLGVKVGKDCRIYTSSFGSEPFLISIGNKVTITSGVKFITHDGSTWLMTDKLGRRYFFSPIVVGNNVFVGVNSIIMPGVKICDRVIVAAGSVVTKSVPPGVIVAGVPARVIGKYSDIEKRMLETYVSDQDIDKKQPYHARVNQVTHKEFKPFLSNE